MMWPGLQVLDHDQTIGVRTDVKFADEVNEGFQLYRGALTQLLGDP